MDIHIDLGQIGFFIALIIVGVASNWYYHRKGLKEGWDNLAYLLSDEGLIDIDEDGEIHRVSDHEFKKFKQSMEYGE